MGLIKKYNLKIEMESGIFGIFGKICGYCHEIITDEPPESFKYQVAKKLLDKIRTEQYTIELDNLETELFIQAAAKAYKEIPHRIALI